MAIKDITSNVEFTYEDKETGSKYKVVCVGKDKDATVTFLDSNDSEIVIFTASFFSDMVKFLEDKGMLTSKTTTAPTPAISVETIKPIVNLTGNPVPEVAKPNIIGMPVIVKKQAEVVPNVMTTKPLVAPPVSFNSLATAKSNDVVSAATIKAGGSLTTMTDNKSNRQVIKGDSSSAALIREGMATKGSAVKRVDG